MLKFNEDFYIVPVVLVTLKISSIAHDLKNTQNFKY